VSPNVKNGEDVGMIQRGGGAGLLLEAAQAFWVTRKSGRQHLDGHIAPQPRIPGAIHLTHTTGTEGRSDFIRPEFRA